MRVMAKHTGFHTLVYHGKGPYPMDSGNCFGVFIEPPAKGEFPDDVNVLNIRWENFAELLKRGVVEMPVEIEILEEGYCVMVDDRIPSGWLADRVCKSCVPERLRERVAAYLKDHCD